MPQQLVFTDKEPGDSLGAAHVNKLNAAARVVVSRFPGAFANGSEYGSTGLVPFTQRFVEVITDVTADPNVLGCKIRYYDDVTDPDNPIWMTDNDDNELDLDVSQIGVELFYQDVIQAYWDPQRNAFIPTWFLPKMIFCKPDEDIDEDADGLCTFYKGLRDDPQPRYNSNGDVIKRYCFNADDPLPAGLDCLAIHHSMMGLDGTGFEHSPDSGQSSGSSGGSPGSASVPTPIETNVRYEIVPLRCPA